MGVCFEVLHVNYSLRGLESQEDEAFLSALCFDLNIPISVNRIDFNSVLKKEKSNLQESARDFRYRWFSSFLEKDESAVLVLAHHLDDQIETFFQHLARKSGIMGMACMLQRNGQFTRPLLQYSKTDIIEYAIENKVSWREDSSNAFNKYTRNKLRNNFIPFVEAQVPSLKKSVQILIAIFQSEIKAITLSVSPIFDRVRTEKQIQFSDFDILSDEQGVELMRLLAYPIDVFFKLKSNSSKLISNLRKFKIN
jgi:tRNA(Ile)-lysidine synthase